MIAHTKVVALGFNVRIDDLVVEKLGVLRPTSHAPIVVVQESAKEAELAVLIQDLDLGEIRELPDERMAPANPMVDGYFRDEIGYLASSTA
jgi:hypothetical protein